MRKALAALTLTGSSVAFAEHKAFQEKYIIGCSTEQIATANSITDSFRTCAEELYGAGTIQEVDDAIDAEDYQGAARKFIAVVNDAMETKGQKELSKGLCACVDSFNSGLPAFLYSRSGGAQPVVSAMDEDEMAMARKKEGGLMAADDADEI